MHGGGRALCCSLRGTFSYVRELRSGGLDPPPLGHLAVENRVPGKRERSLRPPLLSWLAAQATEWGVASDSDMYLAEKLVVGFLGPYSGAVDEHSGLPVAMQLAVLRRVRFVGPDEAPQPL